MKKNWKFATMALIAGVSLLQPLAAVMKILSIIRVMEEKIPMFLTVTLPKM